MKLMHYLNETYALNDGLRIARKVLSDINDLTVPAAGEFLDMIIPQYVADFMSWGGQRQMCIRDSKVIHRYF
ncbi:hypothetical protein RY60_07885 [[Haemophilus] ducreyi]|nr:hypothetical protein RY60_07885 [[Haemophilus] ducreyi]